MTTNQDEVREMAHLDYLLFNFRNAVKHEVEGTNIGSHKEDVVKCKKEILEFFTAHFDTLLAKKREKIKKMPEAGYRVGKVGEKLYWSRDVLSILT